MKRCRRCETERALTEFRADSRYADGFASWCKQCHRERNSEWARENRARLTVKAAEWRKANPEAARRTDQQWKAANKPKLAIRYREWRLRNLAADCERAAARKAKKLKATPKWADSKATREFYVNRPDGFDVDHIVPLISPFVCGLHWVGNLQYLPASANQSKGNRSWPDMPESIAAAYAQGRLFA